MIRIIAMGKIRDKNIKSLGNLYKDRIKNFVKVLEIELKPEKDKAPGKIAIKKESEKILKTIDYGNIRILLDREGKMFDSVEFSKFLGRLIDEGKSVDFVIGGAWGVDKKIFKEFNFILSFSKMTFPHELTRLILYEQIYRAFTIIKRTGYHK